MLPPNLKKRMGGCTCTLVHVVPSQHVHEKKGYFCNLTLYLIGGI